MSIHLTSVLVKHSRRIRLQFDAQLASGAFTTTSYYTVSNQDGKATDPAVVAVFSVPGVNYSVELALGVDLVDGALYLASAIGVPAQAGGMTDSTSTQLFELSLNLNTIPNQEINPLPDLSLILYGRDLIWNGTDLQEDASGDLDTVSGNQNVQQAVWRRLLSDGLPWDQSYGVKARSYVDGAATATTTLQGAIIQQCLADPRVKSTSVQILPDSTPTDVIFQANVTLIGNEVVQSIDISVPTQ